MQESRALFVLWIVCLLPKSLVHCLFSGLFVCFARFLSTVCSLDRLFVTRESRALSVLWIVCLQCKSLVHYFFSGLFVCYARVSCTVFSPGFFIIFTHKSLFNGLEFCTLLCFKFACRLRKNLAHSFFPGFVCSLHKNIAHCFFCSFACLLPKNLAHSFFPGCVCFLHKNLAHCFFSDLLVCYARILCILSPEVCLSVTRESCTQFLPLVCWSVMQESRALFCSDLLVCHARMSCFVSSIDCLLVTRESCAQFLS